MLIITRRINETLIIDNNIKVKILGIKGCQVRIGIDAPKNITVNREEIQQKIDSGVVFSKKTAEQMQELVESLKKIKENKKY